jgi:3-deoxy-D-manno-octulosonic acid kinase
VDSQVRHSSFKNAIPARGYSGRRVELGSPNVDSRAGREKSDLLKPQLLYTPPSMRSTPHASAAAPTLTIEAVPNGLALLDRARVQEPLNVLFDLAHYSGAKTLRDGRGQAHQVTGTFGVGALRHYRRGGLTGALWQDRYLHLGAERTRCFRELRLLALLHDAGFPVPAPLACRFQRDGVVYRADILTAWLPGANPLSAHVQSATLDDFSAIGTMLRGFHDFGLWHADLNAHNILLTDTGPALIDFDRCERRMVDAQAPAAQLGWQAANVARLLRSLTKLGFAARTDFASGLWPALQAAYGAR